MDALAELQDKLVTVITNDGRHIVGTLKGFDQVINIILEECFERVYLSGEPATHEPLGLYVIRGDNIAVIGEVDPELDANVDWSNIVADPLPPIVH